MRESKEKEYETNGETESGSYILDVQLPGGKWLCLDATRSITSWGRYINHGFSPGANIRLMPPVKISDKWRVGFISTRQIMEGEELLYEYGQQSNAPDWLKKTKVYGTKLEVWLTRQQLLSTINALQYITYF